MMPSTDTYVAPPPGVANKVTFKPEVLVGPNTNAQAARFDVRMGPDADKVAVVVASTSQTLAPNSQVLNGGSLTDGNTVPFQILKLETFGVDDEGDPVTVYNRAEIIKRK